MKIKYSHSDRIFFFFNRLLALFFFCIVLYPLLFVVSASFSDPAAVAQGKVTVFPVGFSLAGYTAVFNSKSIGIGYLNSIFYMVAGTIVNVIMAILAAYPLSQKDFIGRKIFTFIIVFTMLFSGGMIPSYLLVNALGLIDSYAAMIIPSAFNAFNAVLVMNFFRSNISEDLNGAAKIDGCNDFIFGAKIVIPLSKSILAVIALFTAVGCWNSYFNAMLYLRDSTKFPLQLVLRDVVVNNQFSLDLLSKGDIRDLIKKQNAQELLKYSTIVVASAPLMMIYPFVQKYFVKGVMIGSVKG